MQVQKFSNNNTTFGAGFVDLKNINQADIIDYDKIREIAEKDKLDLSIRKIDNSKYLPRNNFYTILAKNDGVLPSYGSSCFLVGKKESAKEVSKKLYNAVIKAVASLAEDIKEQTGKMPEFLKYLRKK